MKSSNACLAKAATARNKVAMQQPHLRLYSFPLSGHAHRARLMLSLLGLKAEIVDIDLTKKAHKGAEFLAFNPLGQVPVLEVDGEYIPDSNAILVYLARRFDAEGQWLPIAPLGMARVERWLSLAAGLLAEGPGAARRANVFRAPLDLTQPHAAAVRLFGYMNGVLGQSSFLIGERPTIADIAMYTYTAHAPEGDISLDPYAHIQAWLVKIEALPGFIPMDRWTQSALHE